MKPKLLLLLFGLFMAAGVKAQEYKITMSESGDVYQIADQKTYVDNRVEKVCPLVLVRILRDNKNVTGATFQGSIIPSPNSVEYKDGAYWVYSIEGNYTLRINHNTEFESIDVNMRDYMPDYPDPDNPEKMKKWRGLKQKTKYVLRIVLPDSPALEVPKSSFTLSAGFNVMPLMGPTVGAGFMFHDFTVEGGAVLGLSKSKDIYIYDKGGELQDAYNYSAMRGFLRAGYDLWATDIIAVTPQVGVAFTSVKGSRLSGINATTEVLNGATAISATIGARVMFAPSGRTKSFRLFLTPEFDMGLSKDKNFKALADYDSKIKSWADGLNLNLGVVFYF